MARTIASNRYVAKNYGTCLVFGGNTNKVTTTLTSHGTTRTYAVWAYRTGIGGGGIGRMFEKRVAGAQVELLYFDNTTQTYAYDRQWSGGNATWRCPTPVVNKWVHVAVTYDSSSASNVPIIYFDGVAQTLTTSTNSTGSLTTNTDAYVIGNRAIDNGRGWDGRLDEFRIYDRILSSSEVMNLSRGSEPDTTSFILWHKFDEGSGTSAIDSSGTQSASTISGATYLTTNIPMNVRTVVPYTGSSLSFNGSNSSVTVPDATSLDPTTLTASLWIKLRSKSGFRCALYKNSGSGDLWRYAIQLDNSSDQKWRSMILASNNSTNQTVTASAPAPLNVWQLLTMTWNGTTEEFFINGVSQGTVSATTASSGTNLLYIGASQGGQNIDGLIKDVRVYARVLTGSEILGLYSNVEPSTTSLSALFRFNEGLGTTATDSSGNSNTGTIINATYNASVPLGRQTLS